MRVCLRERERERERKERDNCKYTFWVLKIFIIERKKRLDGALCGGCVVMIAAWKPGEHEVDFSLSEIDLQQAMYRGSRTKDDVGEPRGWQGTCWEGAELPTGPHHYFLSPACSAFLAIFS